VLGRRTILLLCCLLYGLTSAHEQSLEIASHKEAVHDFTDHAERRLETKNVPHGGDSIMLLEVMIVKKGLEGTADHLVTEVLRRVKASDTRRKPLPHSEMFRLPRDLFAKTDQA